MKLGYILAAVVLLFAIGLLTMGMADNEYLSFLGLTFHSSVARGVGLVSMIFSVIAFLVAYGSSLPSTRIERRE